MNPGDLVELCREGGDPVSIGEDDGSAGRDFPVGTLCVYLGPNSKWNRHRLAVNILIDGVLGWVWQNEIKPATGATAAGP
jgi:hypothetical protein